MTTTANTPEHGYITAYAAGGGTVRHIVAVTGDYYGGYAAAAVCGVSPRIRWSNTRWTGESDAYPTPAAAAESAPAMLCRKCADKVARMTAAESTPAPKVSPRRRREIEAGFMTEVSAPAESLEETVNTEDTTPAALLDGAALVASEAAYARRVYGLTYPALNGDVVTQGHADYCSDHGHATHTVDGVDTGRCPRCGELKAPDAPAVTPVRADSVQANTPVTGYHGPNPVTYVRAVKPAPAPGHVVVTWVTADGGTFDETVTNAHIIYTATAPTLDHPGTWTEDDAHTWTAECPATDDGESHYTVRATGECWSCSYYAPRHAAAAGIHPRALELVAVSDYSHGARVILDPATAPAATYGTARAVVTAYFQGGPGRGECVDAVILKVTGGDSHPARAYAALDALEALQPRVSGNITVGQYQTLVDPDSYAGTIFIYGTWTD